MPGSHTMTSSAELTDMGMGTLCLAMSLGILTRALLSKVIKLPYTVMLMIFGLIIGGIMNHVHAGIFSSSIAVWTHISHNAILYIM